MKTRSIQLGFSAILLTLSAYLYLFVPDWWIYGTICIAAGILNIFANAECPFWRFLASTVIVLGTIETLFLVWSIRLVEQSSFLNIEARDALTGQTLPSARDELATEGRLILLPALATFLTISTRLGNSSYEWRLIDIIRTLLLLTFMLAIIPALLYSFTFFVPGLAIIVNNTFDKYWEVLSPSINTLFF
ncbi:unnamed protein product [Meloidogyne enterolobii]|uniref:Uncharacterized protein n=1 Tax=Meloidogyne enterolobii TaxID=390850 RepID=A0ACB0ZR26_MELEN